MNSGPIKLQSYISEMNLKENTFFLAKWSIICVLIGFFSGSASALFLVTLEWVTQTREQNNEIIWFLPFGGLTIGYLYHYLGKEVTKGNNLVLEEYENPQKTIPFRMAPLVLISTLITHLFGGSAGREGTAVQMGAAIADQFQKLFNLSLSDRKTLIILGISAGFASVFGTPLAGAIFALEVVYFSKINIKSIIVSFFVAYIAYFTVEFWQIKHTIYTIPVVPELTTTNLSWVVFVGVLFGLAALVFSKTTHFCGHLFSKTIPYAPLRPFVGGVILALAVFGLGTTKYIGLGIPEIIKSFTIPSSNYDFFIKLVCTSFTLGAGFKGGEVTPLFFIGATLGSALSVFIPLPIALLAGMGFVAVFSGATHTPLACSIMGIELFGMDSGIFIAISCVLAYFASGSIGIYQSQKVKGAKYHLYQYFKRSKRVDL